MLVPLQLRNTCRGRCWLRANLLMLLTSLRVPPVPACPHRPRLSSAFYGCRINVLHALAAPCSRITNDSSQLYKSTIKMFVMFHDIIYSYFHFAFLQSGIKDLGMQIDTILLWWVLKFRIKRRHQIPCAILN